MPEYFFHVILELFVGTPTTQQANNSALAWPSGSQALSPFLASESAASSHRRRSNDPQKASFTLGGVQSTSQVRGRPGHDAEFTLNESQTTHLSASTAASDDKRLDQIFIESTDTLTQSWRTNKMNAHNHISKGIGISPNGLQTKGRYEPLDQQVSDSVWGIVHLYRDADETPGLYGDSLLSKSSNPWYSRATKDSNGTFHPPASDQDCTTLCILAVPSYLAPSDFLGFVGEETREQVSHFRMIRTARANRYMVLIKFRDGKLARNWQKAWNGKVFNSMEVDWPRGSLAFRLMY
jgi:BRCA1-associated protein